MLLGMALLLASPAQARVKEGDDAKPFTGTNFITNRPVDIGQHLKKRVILLDFGSIYCSSCMVTVPNLIKLSKEYPDDKLAICNIYLDIYNTQRVTKFFLGFAKDLQFSLIIDQQLAISRDYGVDTLPTTVIIDKNGKVRKVITGYTEADEKAINALIDDLIREMPDSASSVSATTEQPLSIFSPDSFTKTSNDSVFLVGYAGGQGTKEIFFKLNNLPEKVAKSKNNVFHFRSNLSLAMNLIEVRSQVEEGKFKNESVVIFREPKLGMEIKSELPEDKFHVEEDKKQCVKCHTLSLSAQQRESQESSKMCLSCHGKMQGQIYVHGPISVGGCLPCHDYSSFPARYELRSQGSALCVNCHEAFKDILKSNLHGPVAAGVCTVCHDPHGASEKYLMRKKLDQQCISCHQDTLKDYAKPYIHTPVKEGKCTGCHDPHASSNKYFLKKDYQTICLLCHEEGTYVHMHKTGRFPSKEMDPDGVQPVLDSSGRTICLTCHWVHSSDFEKLTKGVKEGFCDTICH